MSDLEYAENPTPEDVLERLRFVREATTADDKALWHGGATLWVDDLSQNEYWLHPSTLLRHGMTERMREAMAEPPRLTEEEKAERVAEALRERAAAFPSDIAAERHARGAAVVSGSTEEWRWQLVEDGSVECTSCDRYIEHPHPVTVRMWAVDNKPKVDAYWSKEGVTISAPPPEYQHAVIPEEILEAILRGH